MFRASCTASIHAAQYAQTVVQTGFRASNPRIVQGTMKTMREAIDVWNVEPRPCLEAIARQYGIDLSETVLAGFDIVFDLTLMGAAR